jgi:hypothetical protein
VKPMINSLTPSMLRANTLYTFHRANGFYPLCLRDDDEAIRNAFCNPGTLKVVNEMTRKVVWTIELTKEGGGL